MAVQANLTNTSLTLRYKEGVDIKGNDVIKTKKFSNVKVSSTDQAIYDVAEAFSPLLNYPVVDIVKTDESKLMNI